MNASPDSLVLERFRALIVRRLGLQFEDAKLGWLAEILQQRLAITALPSAHYLNQLESPGTPPEIGALAAALTVPETSFFRNGDQFRAFTERVLPERLRAQAARRTLRLLSAGCASGEEPYSLAMLLHERLTEPGWEVSIRAVDINPEILAKARRGRFSEWSLRETPPELQRRWFRRDGRDYLLDERVRTMVRFEERNLAVEDTELWPAETYDAVFCRNVIMYFAPDVARRVIGRIARSLAPGGYLFLGHAETLRGLSQDFRLRHSHDTFYYQRKDAAAQERAEESAEIIPFPVAAPALAAMVEDSDTWVAAIRRAAERVQTLTRPPETPAAAPRRDLGTTLELLRREQFDAALAEVRALPADSARDPDVLLLHAVLLAHRGDFAAARDVSRQLLALDEMNAGAHYVLALCHEGAGNRADAADHDRVAAYLDPAFAMPHLHLGLLARRSGDRATARRELNQALLLLQREDASRLLLFGGGFNRDTLTALCRTELHASGGTA